MSKYEKRTDGGAQSSAGDAFEAALHGAVALLAYSNGIAGEQTCEESGLGCLDDLCFKYKDGDGRKLILLQAKHSGAQPPKEITEVDVKAGYGGNRDTFSLAKYFMAFLEAKRTAMKRGDTVQQVVLFTNRSLSEGLRRKCLECAMKDMKNPLQVLFNFPNYNGALFYKIPENFSDILNVGTGKGMEERKSNRDELVQWWETEGNVRLDELKKEFHEKLIFAVCQPNVQKLNDVIECLFQRLLVSKSITAEGKKGMLRRFSNNLQEWMDERSPGSAGKLYVLPWTSDRTEKCIKNAKAHLTQLKIESLSEANFRLLQNFVEINMSPQFPSGMHVFETQHLTIYARLIVGTKTASQNDCLLLWAEQLTEDLYDGFADMKGIRIVIVHDSQKQSPTVDDIRQQMSDFNLNTTILTNRPGVGTPLPEVQASDLSNATMDKIMERDILFQGHVLKVRDIVDGDHCLRSLLDLDPKIVKVLSMGEELVLGKDILSPGEPYVVRSLEEIRNPTAEPETGEAPWVRRKYFLEEEIILKAQKYRKHVIVSAPPGVGKSSLATSMCSRVKEKHPSWWVGKCDLKEKMTALGKYQKKKRSLRGEESRTDSELTQLEFDLLWELFNVEKVEQRLIKDRLMGSTGHVVFVIDSYDEIAHMYGSEFEAFVKPLAKLNVCLCVTTREHLLHRAKSVLEGHLAFRLEMLKNNEQRDLLVKLWVQKSSGLVETQSLRSDVEYLCQNLPYMFCANPLHLYMISEIDYSSLKKHEISPYQMYHDFVQTKFDRYWGEAMFDSRTEAEKKNKIMENDLTQIAVWHLLGKNHEWNSEEERTLLLKRVQEKNVGFVIDQEHGHPTFVHGSYADYFLSRLVYEKLLNFEEISDVMVSDRFYLVRLLLDGRLVTHQNLKIPLNVLPPGTKDDFLLTPAREGLETLSRYIWTFHKFFSDEIQQKAFILAVENCLQSVLEQAIQDGIDVNKPADGKRALDDGLVGSKSRQEAIVNTLLSKGYELHSKNVLYKPVLHQIISRGTYPAVVQLLIDHGCDVKAVTQSGETALHKAAERGCVDVAELLIKHGCDVKAVTESRETVLHKAAAQGQLDAVQFLIEKGCDVCAVTQTGATALHKASAYGARRVAELLIKKGCDVNAVTQSGENALHYAAGHGSIKFVKLLIEHGCDIHAVSKKGESLLHKAAMQPNIDVVKLLVEKGCDVNAVTLSGETALHIAAGSHDLFGMFPGIGAVGVVRFLIEKGCHVNSVTETGETALHRAAVRGKIELVELLIEKGCDRNAVNQSGETALDKVRGDFFLRLVLTRKGCKTGPRSSPSHGGRGVITFRVTMPQSDVK